MSASDLPAWMWGDPSSVAERKELMDLGCAACASNVVTMMRGCCGHERNTLQKGWPYIGYRCKWFAECEAKGASA